MSVTLHPYQKDIAARTMNSLAERGRGASVAVRLPTGGGKTVIAGALLKRFHKKFPVRANAWLTHRAELRDQSGASLQKMFDLKVSDMSDIAPNERTWRPGYVNLVSPQLRTLPRLHKNPGVMVVDEGHHSPAPTWGKKIDAWREAGGIVIGFSATWWRASRKQGFTDWYDELILGPDFEELEEMGYLSRPHLWAPQRAQMDVSQMRVLGTGDFNVADVEEEALRLLAQKPVMETWADQTEDLDDYRTLWFCPTKITANALKDHIEHMLGERAEVLTGDTPKLERRKIMRDLRDHKLNHLLSVEVIGEGVDIPSVPVIATIRSTQSIAVWLQQSGRGSRPKDNDDTPGGHYLLLDFANNASNLGMPNSPREWYLEPRDTRESGDLGGFVASCWNSGCEDVVLHPAHRHCWNCEEEQYRECDECHDDRRWTRYKKSNGDTCDICVTALVEYKMQQAREVAEAKKRRKVRDYNHNEKKRLRELAKDHVNPASRNKAPSKKRMASYISTLNPSSKFDTGITEVQTQLTFIGVDEFEEDKLV